MKTRINPLQEQDGTESSVAAVLADGNTNAKKEESRVEAEGPTHEIISVRIPKNAKPGDTFQANIGSRIVRFLCHPSATPGKSINIAVKKADMNSDLNKRTGDKPNVRQLAERDSNKPNVSRPWYLVTIPQGIVKGQKFFVTIHGQRLMVISPINAHPGTFIRVVPPLPPTGVSRGLQQKEDETLLFESEVPRYVQPEHPFGVLVTCPKNANPGQRLRFKMPSVVMNSPSTFKFDHGDWARVTRLIDLKLQWVHLDRDAGCIVDGTSGRFDIDRSSYIRKLEYLPGEDPNIQSGRLTLIPAADAVLETEITSDDGGNVICSYKDIVTAQEMTFKEKVNWFQGTCKQLRIEPNEGTIRVKVHRQFILEDCLDTVMLLSPKDLRRLWKIELIGEAGIDADCLTREFHKLVTAKVFDPDMGLWQPSAVHPKCMQIKADSGTCSLCVTMEYKPLSACQPHSQTIGFAFYVYRGQLQESPVIFPIIGPCSGKGSVRWPNCFQSYGSAYLQIPSCLADSV